MKNLTTYELQPLHDSCKSFYGKAKVESWEDPETQTKEIKLISYSTHVATIYVGTGNTIAEVYGDYSITTLRHIKEFLKSFNFKAENKSQIMEDYTQ